MKEYKVGDVVTYINRPNDWVSGPIVRGVIKRIEIYGGEGNDRHPNGCKMYRAVQLFKNGKEKKQSSGYDIFFDSDIVEEWYCGLLCFDCSVDFILLYIKKSNSLDREDDVAIVFY